MKTHFARSVTIAVVTATCLMGSAAVAAADAYQDYSHTRAEPAVGAFTATVDFSSLQERPVRGNKCEFTVNGALAFTGTVDGDAVGTTTAVIFASCAEALTAPPGTYFDVFRFEGAFEGEVLGEPAAGTLSYVGQTFHDGAINATVILDGNGPRAVLKADAVVAVGGTYSGMAKAA